MLVFNFPKKWDVKKHKTKGEKGVRGEGGRAKRINIRVSKIWGLTLSFLSFLSFFSFTFFLSREKTRDCSTTQN